MLIPPKSYKEWGVSANGYEYKTNTDTTDALKEAKTSELYYVGKINHEIFNIPQCLPPYIKVDIKLTLVPTNFILRKELPKSFDVTVSLTSAMLHIRKQHII